MFKKIVKLSVVLLMLSAGIGYARTAINFGVGPSFYGDAMGFNFYGEYSRNLSGWAKLFGDKSGNTNFVFDRMQLGAGMTFDLVPVEFALYTISIDINGGFQFKLSDVAKTKFPLSVYPLFSLSIPFNILANTSGSVVNGGMMLKLGTKVTFEIVPALELGLGLEYKMNFTGAYIGSIGLYACGSILL